MTADMTAFAGLAGLILGSFFNVVAHRVPRGKSLAFPASHCPSCEVPIKPYDNIPVLSWLMLRGRCRACRVAISPRYPTVEALTAVLAVAVVLVKHSTADLVLGLALVGVLIPIALIDLEQRVIPNKITLPAAIAAIAIGLALAPAKVPTQLIAAGAAGGFLLVFAIAYPRGLGMGDVKLAAVLGLYLGASVGVAVLVALVTGTVVGAAIIARVGVKAGRKTAVPFGPFLAVGGVAALLAGPQLVHWYLHTFA